MSKPCSIKIPLLNLYSTINKAREVKYKGIPLDSFLEWENESCVVEGFVKQAPFGLKGLSKEMDGEIITVKAGLRKRVVRRLLREVVKGLVKVSLCFEGEGERVNCEKWMLRDLICNIYPIKYLHFENLTLESKQFISLLTSGANLIELSLTDCYIFGEKTKLPCSGTSKLQTLTIQYESRSTHLSPTNTHEKSSQRYKYYDCLIHNISVLPCAVSLKAIQLYNCFISQRQVQLLQKTYGIPLTSSRFF
ncbi:unnamed protein product [Moneuplotes crassus]|uniref:Uncharacterized protein n=1 Tax=Euplotes crassus TaxID=5936 RepID=A0AAD1XUJ6_EUPCR|nr:unnamed protein product [Moneuplotes crassus]